MLKEVLKNDIRYMKKDPMVWMIAIAPVMLILVYHFAVLRFEFLLTFKSALQYIFTVITSFLVGVVLGFRMLDEKDEHMLSFYAVSPLGLRGYIMLRIMMSIVLAAVCTAILVLFNIIPRAYVVFIGLQAVLIAPLTFLIIGVLGLNKIQGLTLVKIMGMPIILPVLKLIKENPLDKIFVLVPSYNLFQLIVLEEFNFSVVIYSAALLIGIYLLADSFSHKCLSEI